MRGIEPRAFHMQSERSTTELHPLLLTEVHERRQALKKNVAPGEARTHGLQIMRLTRCLLRYGGILPSQEIISFHHKRGRKTFQAPLGLLGK